MSYLSFKKSIGILLSFRAFLCGLRNLPIQAITTFDTNLILFGLLMGRKESPCRVIVLNNAPYLFLLVITGLAVYVDYIFLFYITSFFGMNLLLV